MKQEGEEMEKYYVEVFFEADKIAEYGAETPQEVLDWLNCFRFSNECLRFRITDYLNKPVPYGYYDEWSDEVRWR